MIDAGILAEIEESQLELKDVFKQIEEIAFHNQLKILDAMRECSLSERHFFEATGYGYNDEGRDVCERIYALTFRAEKALVRHQIASGTHAISLALFGLLRPGDEMLSITGSPYDTIRQTIGNSQDKSNLGSLRDFNIGYSQVDLLSDGSIDLPLCLGSIKPNTKLIYLQRSTGYSTHKALGLEEIGKAIRELKKRRKDLVVFVDNCYGELLEKDEPLDYGADIIAGSLIKNPGGGLAKSGGYICGKEEYMDKIAARLTAPGIAYEVGASLGESRSYLQGLFMAPSIVANALKGAALTALTLSKRGYQVFPGPFDKRSDIIQAIVLGSAEKVVAYCNAIQSMSPVDSFAIAEPWSMPGYDDEVIMAAGNFIQGSSIELSADGPMREPFIVYQQGGLTYEHVKIALANAVAKL
ncbi:MAG: methionine gamma-lyase family protein [Eubacteriaceae bacterium]|nr:methionine gamma-lyase family protein [Eubacteriaceae bacterium]